MCLFVDLADPLSHQSFTKEVQVLGAEKTQAADYERHQGPTSPCGGHARTVTSRLGNLRVYLELRFGVWGSNKGLIGSPQPRLNPEC